jgi:hypothetical protein
MKRQLTLLILITVEWMSRDQCNLVQKVEESLYVIQLQKQVDELKKIKNEQ